MTCFFLIKYLSFLLSQAQMRALRKAQPNAEILAEKQEILPTPFFSEKKKKNTNCSSLKKKNCFIFHEVPDVSELWAWVLLLWLVIHLCCLPFRLAELLPFVDINRHWGIISKCLTYSKAASDPFAYSLLRQQYKKVLVTVVNRLLRRDLYPSSGHNSSLDTENDYCLQRIS